jgi:hypothetical protein
MMHKNNKKKNKTSEHTPQQKKITLTFFLRNANASFLFFSNRNQFLDAHLDKHLVHIVGSQTFHFPFFISPNFFDSAVPVFL